MAERVHITQGEDGHWGWPGSLRYEDRHQALEAARQELGYEVETGIARETKYEHIPDRVDPKIGHPTPGR